MFQNGRLSDKVTDLTNLCSDNLATFGMGYSYSFEESFIAAEFSPRHIEEQIKVTL